MLKSWIGVVLAVQLGFHGCAPHKELTREDEGQIRPDKRDRVWFHLTDDRIVTADAYHHVYVAGPSDFVFAAGKRYRPNRNSPLGPISMEIPVDEYDSLCTVWNIPDSTAENEIRYELSDSTYAIFHPSNTVRVLDEEGSAYWCIGIVESDGGEAPYRGRITNEDIEKIVVQSYLTVLDILKYPLGLLIAGGVAYLALEVLLSPNNWSH